MPSETSFYSGFSLRNEAPLFTAYRSTHPLALAGFSYGAILAFEEALHTERRIDLLQLFSPAFFQNRSAGFKRLQLKAFRSNPESYLEVFVKNCTAPSDVSLTPFLSPGSEEELEALLNYTWSKDKIEALLAKGTNIEVHLGAEDAVIDAQAAAAFFTPLVTLYWYKGKGHILKGKSCQ